MRQIILSHISRYFYPQVIFVSAIIKFIEKNRSGILVDAPCGNGETTFGFSKNKKLQVFGYDIDKDSIKNAKLNYKGINLVFIKEDVLNVRNYHEVVDYFCIINSLFLLPDANIILNEIKHILKDDGLLFVIIPNIEGNNFIWFNNTDDKGINKLNLRKENVPNYFNSAGFDIVAIEPLVYTHSYGRRDVKLFSVFSHFYLRFLNLIETFLKVKQPNYYLIVLKK